MKPHIGSEVNLLITMCGFIAQLVEQRTGNAEVTGSNPVEALIFFFFFFLFIFFIYFFFIFYLFFFFRLLSNCLNWKIHCEDHSSLSIFRPFASGSFDGGDFRSQNSFHDS